MANSNLLPAISKRLSQILLSNQRQFSYNRHCFFSTGSSASSEYNPDDSPVLNLDSEALLDNSVSPPSQRSFSQSPVLEDGIDIGIYKAILVGQVGQTPLTKRLNNGKSVTIATVGTGGIRNERIPFPNEGQREYGVHSDVQWHRVVFYSDMLGDLVAKHAQPGSILYLEGNLETKYFTDQLTGIVKRVREIAIRRNGRVVFLGNDGDFIPPQTEQLRGVGYF